MTDSEESGSEEQQDGETPNDWIVCPECGSEDARYVDWRPDPDMTLSCPTCGHKNWQGAFWNGDKEEWVHD